MYQLTIYAQTDKKSYSYSLNILISWFSDKTNTDFVHRSLNFNFFLAHIVRRNGINDVDIKALKHELIKTDN